MADTHLRATIDCQNVKSLSPHKQHVRPAKDTASFPHTHTPKCAFGCPLFLANHCVCKINIPNYFAPPNELSTRLFAFFSPPLPSSDALALSRFFTFTITHIGISPASQHITQFHADKTVSFVLASPVTLSCSRFSHACKSNDKDCRISASKPQNRHVHFSLR